jgi:hypothetical protein
MTEVIVPQVEILRFRQTREATLRRSGDGRAKGPRHPAGDLSSTARRAVCSHGRKQSEKRSEKRKSHLHGTILSLELRE